MKKKPNSQQQKRILGIFHSKVCFLYYRRTCVKLLYYIKL